MNPHPFAKDIEELDAKFSNPQPDFKEYYKLMSKVTDLEEQAKLDQDCINKLNAKVEELETTWYIKLWNKIPRFSLSIRRTN